MEYAIRRYNRIMNDNCYEHLTIGESLSEETENWNLRDMVAEVDYVLGTFYEEGHANNEWKSDDYQRWYREVSRMRRFVRSYEPYIAEMQTTSGHCSKYDNN